MPGLERGTVPRRPGPGCGGGLDAGVCERGGGLVLDEEGGVLAVLLQEGGYQREVWERCSLQTTTPVARSTLPAGALHWKPWGVRAWHL